jgi:tRNA/rRNA methyltransferase
VVRCTGIVTIPIDPRHHSLNLAQAVAITAYEWRTTVLDAPPPPRFREADPPASAELVEGFIGHLEAELEAGGFFHPPDKKPSMMRNLRALFARAQLSEQEVATLRGAVHALAKGRGRVLAKLAAQARGEG